MNFAHYLREVVRGEEATQDLAEEDACRLYAAMLDGGVPELELGAILIALRTKGVALSELLGFHSAVTERLYRLTPPARPSQSLRPVVLPSYNGTRHQPNLLPLLALLLQRFGVPVLMHGPLHGNGRVASAYILRELGVMPCATLAQAQQALESEKLSFVPTAVLCPGLATLLALRDRLGVRSSAHTLTKLIDPFGGEGFRIVSATDPVSQNNLREFLLASGSHALLLQSTEGEAFANPRHRPELEYFRDGERKTLFEAEAGALKTEANPAAPVNADAYATAAWTKRALNGEALLPLPLVNQLACCLYGAGYTEDMNQAKAIVAVETGSLASA